MPLPSRTFVLVVAVVGVLGIAPSTGVEKSAGGNDGQGVISPLAAQCPTHVTKKEESAAEDREGSGEDLVKLQLDLPEFRFPPSPLYDFPEDHPHLIPDPLSPREHPNYILVPPGTKNVALNKPVWGSSRAVVGDLRNVTDGDRRVHISAGVELLGSGKQCVQIDLRESHHIYKVLLWHQFAGIRVYRDVVVQVSDDPEFQKDVRTIFNNDWDNSLGLGKGQERGEYIETPEGKLVDGGGVTARYVRLYSRGSYAGSSANKRNQYREVAVYGSPGGTADVEETAREDEGAGTGQVRNAMHCRAFDFSGTDVTGEALAELTGLEEMRVLKLRDTEVSGAGLAHLDGPGNLRELYLDNTRVTDDGLSHVERLKKLRVLHLRETGITDRGLAHLETLNKLRSLDLGGTSITDEGLAHLEGLKDLRYLNLKNTNVTNEGVQKLKEALPELKVKR